MQSAAHPQPPPLAEQLAEERRSRELLERLGALLVAELDLDRLVQLLTDESTRLVRAQFGAFFYNVLDAQGGSYMLYALSGVPREAFSRFPMPRATAVFAPTFKGEGVVRSDDITKDPRYGHNAPHHGMPEGHLPVRSYLAVPVISRTGEVHGGLFFGHAEPGVFGARDEALLTAVAPLAAVAIDNARLHDAAGRARAGLEAQLALFRALADSLPHIVWSVRPDGTTEFLSARAADVFGRPLPQLQAQGFLDLIHPDDRAAGEAAWRRAAEAGGAPFEYEQRMRRHDGVWRWHVVRGAAVKAPDGRLERWFGTTTDVHDARTRSTQERFLAEATTLLGGMLDTGSALEQLARLAVPHVADWFALDLVREGGRVERVAAAHREPDKTRLALELARRYPARLDNAAGAGAVMRTGRPELHEHISPATLEAVAHDAEHLTILRELGLGSAMVAPLTARGRTLGAVTLVNSGPERPFGPQDLVFAQDFARRAALALDNVRLLEQTRAALAAREASLHQLAAQHEAMSVLARATSLEEGINGVLDAFNRHLPFVVGAFFAPKGDRLVARCVRERPDAGVTEEFLAATRAASVAPFEGLLGTVWQEGVGRFSPDVQQKPRWVRREAAQHADLHGGLYVPVLGARGGVLGVLELISHERLALEPNELETLTTLGGQLGQFCERMAAEAALRELNQQLERRVEERTQELRAALGELEAFSYSVSHDLRAPLRHIAGFADLLVKKTGEGGDATQRRYAENVREAGVRAGRLVDDLLAFSRMGRAELQRQEVALAPLVTEVWRELAPDLAGRRVQLTVLPLPTVRGDAAMLRQVYANLLANAVKFTRPRPEAHVEVGARAAGERWELWVKDDGVGFDPRYAHKLFGVFHRLHAQEEFEGTGIGLALVRRIVQRHGGETWAEGRPGEGATLSFSLPREG